MEARIGAMWRLGPPAALMVAFLLIGLAPWSWRGRADVPRSAPPLPPVTIAVETDVTPVVAATADSIERAIDGEPGAPSSAVADQPESPIARVPEELEPMAPDIVVALEPPPLTAQLLARAHTHLEEGVYEAAQVPVALAPQTGDDFQGPEPGALYWFGPNGLERVEVLGEARR